MALKYTNNSNSKAPQNIPELRFWFKNKYTIWQSRKKIRDEKWRQFFCCRFKPCRESDTTWSIRKYWSKKRKRLNPSRVARWFIFVPKIPIWVNFRRALHWKMFIYFKTVWSYFQTFGIFYDHLVHFVFIGYIFPVLVTCTKKNLATLNPSRFSQGKLFNVFNLNRIFSGPQEG
jgi:hypothetical protein